MKRASSNKKSVITGYADKLIAIAEKGIRKERYKEALQALSAYCTVQYEINQVYTDASVEKMIGDISSCLVSASNAYKPDSRTVLFYDGFGLDLRGWAISYVRAIARNGYRLIYVTNESCKDSIPHILREMEGFDTRACYINMSGSQVEWIKALSRVFEETCPKFAFFYTKPYDVAAAAVFRAYNGRVYRAQVDLTDHAFWIGVKSVDCFLECRILGASNALYHRGVQREQIVNIDCSLYINRDADDTALPFDIANEAYIFSGGDLYKTLGDDDLLFYKVIDLVLEQNQAVKYLYAGKGDCSELEKLARKYPNRVYYIHERKDFYRLIENCVFMWNTYPMFGGLMMRYAARAGKIPLTLKHGNDHEGLLKKQSELGIEFDTWQEVVEEAGRLLEDADYRKAKEGKLTDSVMSEAAFQRNIKLIIENHDSEYHFGDIPHLDTTDFRRTYIERIDDPMALMANCIIRKTQFKLWPLFPNLFIRKIASQIKGRS